MPALTDFGVMGLAGRGCGVLTVRFACATWLGDGFACYRRAKLLRVTRMASFRVV